MGVFLGFWGQTEKPVAGPTTALHVKVAGVLCCGHKQLFVPAKFHGKMLYASTVFFFCVFFSYFGSLLGINECFFSLAPLYYIFALLFPLVLCSLRILT